MASYKCVFCPKVHLPSRKKIEEHLLKDHLISRWDLRKSQKGVRRACPECTIFTSEYKVIIKEHRKLEHSSSRAPCRKKQPNQETQKLQQCALCPEQVKVVRTHYTTKHGVTVEELGWLCQELFDDSGTWESFTCAVSNCCLRLPTMAELLTHWKEAHLKQLYNILPKPVKCIQSKFSCCFCPNSFPSRVSFRQHFQSEHALESYSSEVPSSMTWQCPECSCIAKQKDSMVRHVLQEHPVEEARSIKGALSPVQEACAWPQRRLVSNDPVDTSMGNTVVSSTAVSSTSGGNASMGNTLVGNTIAGNTAVSSAMVGNTSMGNTLVDNTIVSNTGVSSSIVGDTLMGNTEVGNTLVGKTVSADVIEVDEDHQDITIDDSTEVNNSPLNGEKSSNTEDLDIIIASDTPEEIDIEDTISSSKLDNLLAIAAKLAKPDEEEGSDTAKNQQKAICKDTIEPDKKGGDNSLEKVLLHAAQLIGTQNIAQEEPKDQVQMESDHGDVHTLNDDQPMDTSQEDSNSSLPNNIQASSTPVSSTPVCRNPPNASPLCNTQESYTPASVSPVGNTQVSKNGVNGQVYLTQMANNQALKARVGNNQVFNTPAISTQRLNSEVHNAQMGNTLVHNARMGNTQMGNTQTGNTRMGNTQTGNTRMGNTQMGNTPTGNTQVHNTQLGNTRMGNTQMGNKVMNKTQMDSNRVPVPHGAPITVFRMSHTCFFCLNSDQPSSEALSQHLVSTHFVLDNQIVGVVRAVAPEHSNSSTRMFVCPACEGFHSSSLVKVRVHFLRQHRHLLRTQRRTTYACSFCDFWCQDRAAFSQHYAQRHPLPGPWPVPPPGREPVAASFQCPACPHATSSCTSMRAHYAQRACHGGQAGDSPLKACCCLCLKSFSTPDQLKRHYRTHFRKLRPAQTTPLSPRNGHFKFGCPECGYVTSQGDMRQHICIHPSLTLG